MNSELSRQVIAWEYPEPYALYSYANERDHIQEADEWGKSLFAVLDEGGQLIGEVSFGFLDFRDGWVPQADVDAGRLEGSILWIGFGMRPDLTGQGRGLAFVQACVDFAIRFARSQYGYSGEFIGLGVYQFNERAIKVYERAGFETFYEGSAVVQGKELKTQRMRRRVDPG
jgi:ribosomal-protein-alanine N-acetyltransferase